MKKKLYTNEEEINRFCILQKWIKLKKQDFNLSIYVYVYLALQKYLICAGNYHSIKVTTH